MNNDDDTLFKKGDQIWYKNISYSKKAKKGHIENVHLDDYPHIYYTIILTNGDEKQTIPEYLHHRITKTKSLCK